MTTVNNFKKYVKEDFTIEEMIEIGTYGCHFGIKNNLLKNDQLLYLYDQYRDDFWNIINKMANSLALSEWDVLDIRKRYPNFEQRMDHSFFCKMIVWTCTEIVCKEILSEDKDKD